MLFSNDLEFAEYISTLGGSLWKVGGCLRDEFLGRPVTDTDYVVTGLEVSELKNLDKIVGQDFPVFLVEIGRKTCEVAMARREKKEGVGYHGFTFYSGKDVTIQEDLARRDLTINAMALNVLTREFVDPYNGKQDIINKVLRHTSPAFVEDPLRVFRVARFSAQLGFTVDDTTIALMRSITDTLKDLKAERVWKELEKALKSNKPSYFFWVLFNIGGLDYWFPEVKALDVPDMHDGTALNHTMKVLDEGGDALSTFGLLCHDFGKGRTPAEEHPKHHGHDQLGVEAVEEFCTRLKVPTEYREIGVLACSEHMRIKRLDEMKAGKFFRWVTQNEKNLYRLFNISFVDSLHREGSNKDEVRSAFLGIWKQIGMAVEAYEAVTGASLIAEGYLPKSKHDKKFGETLFSRRVHYYQKLLSQGR